MAFDQSTRNRLARFVADARSLLTEEFTRQVRQEYGLDPDSGDVTSLERLSHLDDARSQTAQILRSTLAHYLGGPPDQQSKTARLARKETLNRIVREQAFTVLNRLCALRMAEARGLLVESVAKGYSSDGFQLYSQLAGSGLGETGDAYRIYLFSVFDELAMDLPVLFDRFSPEGRLFPRNSTLLDLLQLINDPGLEQLWPEDETIGWTYQYFNSQDERRQMRAESQTPRNSRELAVRNQFFTPRYVVEFLTDNTLGRIWYEMTRGQTQMVDSCRYLVRRPREIFLGRPNLNHDSAAAWVQAVLAGDFSAMPDHPTIDEIGEFALLIDGYELAPRYADENVLELGSRYTEAYIERNEPFPADALTLWFILFAYQRGMIRHGFRSPEADDPFQQAIRAAYNALRHALQNPPDDLSQEEMLNQPVFVPRRPLKDPREILMLDPACGSMHFGLYAFDLYETIYVEAWEMQANGGWRDPQISASNRLSDDYPDKDDLLRAIPRLIIEHNIHGIDIDPRAVQIAGLSLWLRAQRSWQEQRVKPQDRPTIRRSNIVCAEPMPGDRKLLEEFLKELREERLESLIRKVIDVPANQRVTATPSMVDALSELISTVWHEMALAGEAGSLLKIEESLTAAIDHARNEWEQRLPLFRVQTFRMTGEATDEKPTVNYLKVVPGEGVDFWDRAEALVLAALEEYAAQAENGASYQRRLFAQDAARGFAFIDLCRKRYDVSLMNPPFGTASKVLQDHLSKGEFHNRDLASDFVTNAIRVSGPNGLVGAITTRTIFFLKGFMEWRDDLINSTGGPQCFLDIGYGVLDAAVEASALTLKVNSTDSMGYYIRGIGLHEEMEVGKANKVFQCPSYITNGHLFSRIPRHPFAYWISPQLITAFSSLPTIGDEFEVLSGGNPRDDFRFVRLWVEIPTGLLSNFVPYSKGGEFSLYYYDVHLALKWKNNAEELKVQAAEYRRQLGWSPDWRALMMNYDHYFLPGITWPRRTSRLSFRFLPKGCVFGDKSPVIIPGAKTNLDTLLPLIAYLNSSSFNEIVSLMVGSSELAQSFEVGIVKACPSLLDYYLQHTSDVLAIFNDLRLLDSTNEGSHAFVWPSNLLRGTIAETHQRLYLWQQDTIHRIIDAHSRFANIAYSTLGIGIDNQQLSISDLPKVEINEFVENLMSYFWGCVFSRWDIRHATGERQASSVDTPFDPVPACSEGMLQNADSLPATSADVPADYPLRISWPGILVDDPGHPEDVEGRMREALAVIWQDNHNAIEQEACEILSVNSLRAYFANPNRFFDDHLKRYSKSRRVAPIYWPLSTPSGFYTLWLYYHRINDQILYTCVNDFVDPKLAQVGEELEKLRRTSTRSAAQEDEFGRLSDLARELKDFREALLRIAAFWRPNLNDGVQITAAPLWSLFQHRGWQKRLRETWDQLEAGDYDWAHLALSIWPARVVPKCVEDRSLAIAHEVEDLFWVEDDDTGWRPLQSPDAEITARKKRWSNRLSAKQRQRILDALHELAAGSGRGVPAAQVAQHLSEGHWDDTEVALLFWPERVAEQCLADPFLADRLRLNLPEKRTQTAIKRWTKTLVEDGVPNLADALLATLDLDVPFEQLVRQLEAGQRDELPLSLALWPERVIEQCVRDVDMATAHGLRKYFWVEHPDNQWRRRLSPHREVTDEVARRG